MDISKVIILSDMDGTLLTDDKRINDVDRLAIDKFLSMGGKFTISTGRTVQTFAQYRKMLDLRMPVVLYNGGMIYDYISEKILYSCPLPDESRSVTERIMSYMPECGGEVLREDGTYVFSNNRQEQLHTDLCRIKPYYMNLEEIPCGGWLKVLFALEHERIGILEDKIRRLGFYEKLDFVRSSDIFLEMLPKGINKGSAVGEYRKLEGMGEYTFVAVGDFDNDIEMIANADIGVCPANAEKTVRETADIVLSRTNNDGAMAELIDYLINKRR